MLRSPHQIVAGLVTLIVALGTLSVSAQEEPPGGLPLPIEPPSVTPCPEVVITTSSSGSPGLINGMCTGASSGSSTNSGADSTRVWCWDWAKTGAPRSCHSPTGSWTYKSPGIYRCEGPEKGHEGCNFYGKPSDGTIDVCGNSCTSYEQAAWGWSLVCSDGSCYPGNEPFKYKNKFTIVISIISHGTGGTFGGFAVI